MTPTDPPETSGTPPTSGALHRLEQLEAPAPRRRSRRTWPERMAIIGTFASALLCIAVAAALVIGYSVVRQRNIADLENPAEAAGAAGPVVTRPAATTTIAASTTDPATTGSSTTARPTTTAGVGVSPAGSDAIGAGDTVATPSGTEDLIPLSATEPGATDEADVDVETVGSPTTIIDALTASSVEFEATTEGPAATFPDADPDAKNFLITGADNGACIDPDSPMAGGIGDREAMGERSDTIMLVRVDPSADRVAVLSFPRDLYVEIADTGNTQRINSAYEPGAPQRLADTIYQNFGIGIDHYIQVDFCAFKTLVDSVGGVAIPFEYPTRDENTGLLIETPGCVTLDGDMALAYVRSRHYQYEDPAGSGEWQTDGTSDLGRISRQQDFLRRLLATVLDEGLMNPSVVRGLIDVGTQYVVTDRALSPAKMMEFAGVMSDVDPESITTYQIDASSRNINGNSVLIPSIDGENMQAVLALFQGKLSLADAPVQQFEQTTTVAPRGSTTTVPTDDTAPGDTGADGSAPATSGPDSSTGAESTEAAETTEVAMTAPGSSEAAIESVGSTEPSGEPQENQFGIVPPRDVQC